MHKIATIYKDIQIEELSLNFTNIKQSFNYLFQNFLIKFN